MNKTIFFFFFISISISKICYSQWVEQEQIKMFSNRVDSPIEITVSERNGQYAFYAENRSSYSFELELKTKTVNLRPDNYSGKFVLQPGINHLVTLTRKSTDMGSNYSYTYKYGIGDPNHIPETNYSYLIPTGKGNTTKLFYSKQNNRYYMKDCFTMDEGDTVYCMRKGYVTAVPGMYHASDRIAKTNSLEICHSDGTIMIYENLNEDQILIEFGKKVYPGQPLGTVNKEKHLKVQLYSLIGDYKLRRLNIKYFYNDTSKEFSDEMSAFHAEYPDSLIIKEMSKRELKKFKKGKLQD